MGWPLVDSTEASSGMWSNDPQTLPTTRLGRRLAHRGPVAPG
jgi:hypothetical protein